MEEAFMIRTPALALLITLVLVSGACGPSQNQGTREQVREPVPEEPVEPQSPLNFKDLPGTWKLMYGSEFGYDFRLRSNYQAWVILYLQSHTLVFKGIYTIEEGSRLRINITEMKSVESITNVSLYGGFVKANSSYFQFKGTFSGKGKEKALRLVPERIIIDGNNSDGYFEPVIRLKRG